MTARTNLLGLMGLGQRGQVVERDSCPGRSPIAKGDQGALDHVHHHRHGCWMAPQRRNSDCNCVDIAVGSTVNPLRRFREAEGGGVMSIRGDPSATEAVGSHLCAGRYGPLGSDEPRRAVLFRGQPTAFGAQADEVIQ